MSNKQEKRDKQHRYPWPVIETAVQFHIVYKFTYRAISEKMLEHGVEVSYKTVFEWVRKFSDTVNSKLRKRSSLYSIEESYVKCNGEWLFMYRAVDSKDATLGVLLRPKKNVISAKNFFKKALSD
jgi:transposase-like protein